MTTATASTSPSRRFPPSPSPRARCRDRNGCTSPGIHPTSAQTPPSPLTRSNWVSPRRPLGCENPGMVLGGRREQSLDRLSGARVDVLVIGGGAIGASTALHAARAGATVALVDRGDLAGGTSSASSKLVHGGLRYL